MLRLTKRRGVTSSARRTRTRPGTRRNSKCVDTRYAFPLSQYSASSVTWSTFSPKCKFADPSEYGYGVAILSESKYGFSCQGNFLRISLLRAATAPDAEQDQGALFAFTASRIDITNRNGADKHEFSWALYPHRGHFLQSDVHFAAYLFNSPLHGTLLLLYSPESDDARTEQ